MTSLEHLEKLESEIPADKGLYQAERLSLLAKIGIEILRELQKKPPEIKIESAKERFKK